MFHIIWDPVPHVKNVKNNRLDYRRYNARISENVDAQYDLDVYRPLINLRVPEYYHNIMILDNDTPGKILEICRFEDDLFFIKGERYQDDLSNFELMHLLSNDKHKINWFYGSQFFHQFDTDIYDDAWEQIRIHSLTNKDRVYPCLIACSIQDRMYKIKIECLAKDIILKPRFDDPSMLMWKDCIKALDSSPKAYMYKQITQTHAAHLVRPFIIDRKDTAKIGHISKHEVVKFNDSHKYSFNINKFGSTCKTDVTSEILDKANSVRISTEFELSIKYDSPDHFTKLVLDVMSKALNAYLPQ